MSEQEPRRTTSEAIKRERAAALARRVERAEGEEREGQRFVVVRMGRERFGFAVAEIERLQRVPDLTRLPGAPAWVCGAASLAGEAVTVLDLATLLGVLAKGERSGAERRLVVATHAGRRVACLVDEVMGVERVRSPHEFRSEGWLQPEQSYGVAENVVLLRLGEIVSDPRLRIGAGRAGA